jgi:ABC-type bacteriocin/lantibiotic exporter with double-glycine peptidase domain
VKRAATLAAITVAAACAGCQHFGAGALPGPETPAMAGQSGWTLVPGVPLVLQGGPADCGEAALEMVLRYWQPRTTSRDVRAVLAPRPGPNGDDAGIEAGRLRAVARDRGLSAFLVRGALDDLRHEVEQHRPVIVGLVRRNLGKARAHYVVVVGVNQHRNRLLAADPQYGWREVSESDFRSEWDPAGDLTLVMLPPGA